MKVLSINNSCKPKEYCFKGLLGSREIVDLASSEFYHYSKDVQYYYPFKNEPQEVIDAFLKHNSTSFESEVMGEVTSATTETRPMKKLNFTKKQYESYKSRYKKGLPLDKVGVKVETELKNRGLYKYLNEMPKPEYFPVIKSIFGFVKKLFR